MMVMADLNKEDEDNAEPPELHCCKHCAKDVALQNVVAFFCVFLVYVLLLCVMVMKVTRAHETRSPRMFWMESPVKDLWKFCPNGIYKWFMYNSFVLYFVNSAPIENRGKFATFSFVFIQSNWNKVLYRFYPNQRPGTWPSSKHLPMYSPEVPELSLILLSTNLELPEDGFY